jgi:chemotaxis protein methyltransferase CheR
MAVEIAANTIERFRSVVAGRLGLHFDDGRRAFLADVLQRRIETAGRDVDAYLSRLEWDAPRDEIAALALELTVPETYFFRHVEQYRAFIEVVVPERLAHRRAERRLRILSLGCASGEEPYTLAMLVRDAVTDPAWDVSILGVDVNPAVLEQARRGRFSAWALRDTPAPDRDRWFRAEGREFVLDAALRASVRFEQHNLVDDDPQLWRWGSYDVVFCRNVVMYFAPEQAQRVIARIARALCPGGYLFLGHAETLRGISSDFHLQHTHETFYYQRKEQVVQPSVSSPASEPRALPIASLCDAAADTDTWVEAIRRASERVVNLTDSRPQERTRRGSVKTSPTPSLDLGLVFELLRKERFAEALTIVEALPPASGRDPDVLLLRAVLLVHGGQLADADAACRGLLEVDELSAGAHYLLALCREGAGDCAAATHHDQAAAYLDPGFAMPHLHLGLLARRGADHTTARQALGHALVLLRREDASRVLLFGGGFSREALIALCRTELVRCGGQP